MVTHTPGNTPGMRKAVVKGAARFTAAAAILFTVLFVMHAAFAASQQSFTVSTADTYTPDESIHIQVTGPSDTPFTLTITDSTGSQVYSRTASTNGDGRYAFLHPPLTTDTYTVTAQSNTAEATASFTVTQRSSASAEQEPPQETQPTETTGTQSESTSTRDTSETQSAGTAVEIRGEWGETPVNQLPNQVQEWQQHLENRGVSASVLTHTETGEQKARLARNGVSAELAGTDFNWANVPDLSTATNQHRMRDFAWVTENRFPAETRYNATLTLPDTYPVVYKCTGTREEPVCHSIPHTSNTDTRPYYVEQDGATVLYMNHFSGGGGGDWFNTSKEYRHNITNTETSQELFGLLNGSNGIDEGFDPMTHWIYGTWTGTLGEQLQAYREETADGGWNLTQVANTSTEYCSVQTLPINHSSCPTPAPGLKTFYALDETGSNAWDHINQVHATINGAPTQDVLGKRSQAYQFDGASDALTADPSDWRGNITVAAWVRADATSQEEGTAVFSSNNSANAGSFQVDVGGSNNGCATGSTAEYRFRAVADDSTAFSTCFNDVSTEWQFLAVTVNGSTVKTYQNKTLVSTETHSFTPELNRYRVAVNRTGTGFFDGRIDSVRIYNRTLTQSELTAIYNTDTSVSTTEEAVDRVRNVSATPNTTGYGKNVTVDAVVEFDDPTDTVILNVTYPDDTWNEFTMENVSDIREWQYNFSDTFQNGDHSFSVWANSTTGFTDQSSAETFTVSANASMSIVTDNDTYGPNEDVKLTRSQIVAEEPGLVTDLRVSKQVEAFLDSDSFEVHTGRTDPDHTDTHAEDGTYFNMTEADQGSGASVDDAFDGVYTYSTDMSTVHTINVSTLGSVDGGTWDLRIRNYATNQWEALHTFTETTDTRKNTVICQDNTANCGDYLNNGELEIAVNGSSSGNTNEFTFQIDEQHIDVETDDGSFSKNDSANRVLGLDGQHTRRHYTKFDLTTLPVNESATIDSAELTVETVANPDTINISHTRNFTNTDSAETIYKDGAPSEASQTNPIHQYSNTGNITVDVTTSVNDTFTAGKRYLAYIFNEAGENEKAELGDTLTLKINYTAESELANTGDTNLTGYLVMRIQRNEAGSWTNVDTPVVDQNDGSFNINTGNALNLSQVWSNHGGWNTETHAGGDYRVLSKFVDENANTLTTDDNTLITDTYPFTINAPNLSLDSIEHENQEDNNINEYETGDILDWVNATVNNTEETAVNATVHLNILDENDNDVPWGPDSTKICGDLNPGDQCEKQFNNESNGYPIPIDAGTETFIMTWNATLDAENAESTENNSLTFTVHDLPDNFTSELTSNKIFRNESTVYNFTIENLWSNAITDVNISVNCNSNELNCTVNDGAGNTSRIDSLAAGAAHEASFNISTNASTDASTYDINATVEYVNPGNEKRVWEEQQNKELRVILPGSFINASGPATVTRDTTRFNFTAEINNTNNENITNQSVQWHIPDHWTNASGNLSKHVDVHEPGEIIWVNFTADIDVNAALGEHTLVINVTNDQQREDEDTVITDVYADTATSLSFNESDPAVNETIEVTGSLTYDNGTVIQGEELNLTDETSNDQIGNGSTDGNGDFTTTYQPPKPLGDHRINVTYTGSAAVFTNANHTTANITVHDHPNITAVAATPALLGYGFNTTINATVTDNDGISTVDVDITYPNGSTLTSSMVNTNGDVWEYNVTDTWQEGAHEFTITATDTFDITNTSTGSFTVDINETSTIAAKTDTYFNDENVNLTTSNTSWWNTSWSHRRHIQVNETSGTELEKYPVKVNLSNLGAAAQNDCSDLRAVENGSVTDLYIDTCDTSGNTIAYAAVNSSASATEEDLYLYYGNSDAASSANETYAYPITDSGFEDGATLLDNTYSYNNENAIFRNITVIVNEGGNTPSATVEAYDHVADTWRTLYDAAPTNGETIVAEDLHMDANYTKVHIVLEDTHNSPQNVNYSYNFNTHNHTDTTTLDTENRFPSLIENTGKTRFKGRVLLQVLSNATGSWDVVSTRVNDTAPRTFNTGGKENLGTLWNADPWNTDKHESGFYKARFQLLDPGGNVLTGSPAINRNDTFTLEGSAANVSIETIEVYNVTSSSNNHTDTTDLEAAGTNTTLPIPGGETYRFDITVNNSVDAEANWTIDPDDVITYANVNSSWTIHEHTDIFYENNTENFIGGTFTNGDVDWNTSLGGRVQPGNNATFSYVVEIPNKAESRGVTFTINDTAFVEEDVSTLDIFKQEQDAPDVITFTVTDNLTRGQDLEASAKWDEVIDQAEAAYNATSTTVTNHTVSTVSGQWTNHTDTTDSGWVKGNHSFRFWAADANPNWNNTQWEWVEVYGLTSVTDTDLNTSTVQRGEPVRFACQVTDDAGNQVNDYNVSFYNESSLLGYGLTNTTGWANTTFSTDQIGDETLTCNITRDLSRYYKTDAAEETSTVTVVEPESPKHHDTGENLTQIFKTPPNSTVNLFANWTDNEALDTALLSTNDTGTWKNNSLHTAVNLSSTVNWSNFTFDMPDNRPLIDMGWRIFANDTSNNFNATRERLVEIWAHTTVIESSSSDSKDPVTTGEDVTYTCNVLQGNGSAAVDYPVTFYDNETGSFQELGSNTTNSGGDAVFTTSYSSAATIKWKCNITKNDSLHMQPLDGFTNYSETLNVETGDTTPPQLVNDNYFLNDSTVFKGASLLSAAEWNENIDTAFIEVNRTSTDLENVTIPTPYTNNWTNHTIDTNTSWQVGTHFAKTYANDSAGNLNDTLRYLRFDVWGYANVSWTAPETNASRGLIDLYCGVHDNQTGDPVSDYSVDFYDPDLNLIGSNTTNSTGTAQMTYDAADLAVGDHQFTCEISDATDLYYNTSVDQTQHTFTITGALNTSTTAPVNGSIVTRGQSINLESITRSDNGTVVTPDTATWYNTTHQIGTGENTTWTVTGSPGLETLNVTTEKTDYEQGNDTVTLDIFGWANTTWRSPDNGNHSIGSTLTLTAHIRDNTTDTGIKDYPVSFYYNNTTTTDFIGSNTTNSTGHAVYNWDTSGLASGNYTLRANITDNTTVSYNASVNNEDSTIVNLTAAGGGTLHVTMHNPAEDAIIPHERNVTVNATVTCKDADCGSIDGTARYNASGTNAGTAIPTATGSTPFYVQSGTNPKSCGSLNQDASCTLTWTVNATGSLGSIHALDVNFDGGSPANDTEPDHVVEIGKVLLLNVSADSIAWGEENPNQENIPAPNNPIQVDLLNNSNDGSLWIKGTALTSANAPGDTPIHVTNISWCNGCTGPTTATNLSDTYDVIQSNVDSYDPPLDLDFWLDTPPVYHGKYTGNITIMANTSWPS